MESFEEKELFDQYIRATGLKDTAQRRAILEAFLSAGRHVSVDDMYGILNASDRRVGYATVHRTMKLIADCGLARQVQLGDGIVRFEPSYRREHHHHLVCTRCRKVVEFSNRSIDEGERSVLEQHGFRMQSHRYEIFGLCAECQKDMAT